MSRLADAVDQLNASAEIAENAVKGDPRKRMAAMVQLISAARNVTEVWEPRP